MENMLQPEIGAGAEEKRETENNTSISGNDSDINKIHTVNSSGKNRLFGRQKPVHHVLGGGKCNVTCLLIFISVIFNRKKRRQSKLSLVLKNITKWF